MASRMDRYKTVDSTSKKRTERNSELYRDIYNQKEYNLDDVKPIGKAEEINVDSIKEMLKKEVRPTRVERTQIEYPEVEEKNYDIRQLLTEAKESKSEDGFHSFIETDDVFRELREKRRKELEHDGKTEDELKDLINTITGTSALNSLEHTEVGLDLLDDLKSGDTDEVATKDSIKEMLSQAKKESSDTVTSKKIDTAFYTSGLKFGKDDFEDLGELNESVKKNNIMIKVVLFIVCTLVALGAIYLVFSLLK